MPSILSFCGSEGKSISFSTAVIFSRKSAPILQATLSTSISVANGKAHVDDNRLNWRKVNETLVKFWWQAFHLLNVTCTIKPCSDFALKHKFWIYILKVAHRSWRCSLVESSCILHLKWVYRADHVNYTFLSSSKFSSFISAVRSVRKAKSRSNCSSSSCAYTASLNCLSNSFILGNSSPNLSKNLPLLNHLTSVWSAEKFFLHAPCTNWANNFHCFFHI